MSNYINQRKSTYMSSEIHNCYLPLPLTCQSKLKIPHAITWISPKHFPPKWLRISSTRKTKKELEISHERIRNKPYMLGLWWKWIPKQESRRWKWELTYLSSNEKEINGNRGCHVRNEGKRRWEGSWGRDELNPWIGISILWSDDEDENP